MTESCAMVEEWQLVDIADFQHLRPIEIGDSSRSVDRAFVVEGSVVGCVSRGGGIDVLGESVRSLNVTSLPAPRDCSLKRVVNGISVVGEDLIAGISVQAGRGCARDGIGKCVVSNGDSFGRWWL